MLLQAIIVREGEVPRSSHMACSVPALLLTGEEVLHGELELGLVLLCLPLELSPIHQFGYVLLCCVDIAWNFSASFDKLSF